MERLEPFRQALVDLRRRIRDGELGPGARVTAKEVAEGLKLSPTPVREALSRLAGEGLLEERRGDGFFVPELSAADIAVLYRLSEQLLLIAQAEARDGRAAEAQPDDDPVRAVERLFFAWTGEVGSRVILEAYRTVAIRLAPVRRCEVEFIDDLAQEAEQLQALASTSARDARAEAIKRFHRRRVALAERLSKRLAPPASEGDA
ncbi:MULTISPECIES: GntR family transcriptional regulator [unclassified Phenylobacterium]|uniref:GntR family transcriptional regulator n=1 Tax=unclassified Phenylobacterium TaxID=2640670 RepID=UPI00083A8C7C|nr:MULTISPECIES: GntR family transcriptional regulator [unclassified Phenylobacterium]